ncbi:MAG: trypsin-like peptidase domain-containing protein, partial [Phycisphaerae bacterium]
MIESGGLVMASNLQLGGISESMRSFMSPGMSMTPKDIKVLIGDDTEGVEAKVIARDSELDLAWVQIEKKSEKPYAAIDFANAGKVVPGQTLYSVERLGKFFDRAATMNDFRIGAVVTKPRKLYSPAERLSAG